jgi:uncharacterized protein (TIGR02118 family)
MPGSVTTRPEARRGEADECIRHSIAQGFGQVDNTVAHRDRKETMIKLSILMVRRSDLTYEQFIQHWGEVHGPLFAAQSESKQYVRRYIQDHRTSDALPGTTASNFDGIAEIWFDDISGAKAFFASDGYRQNVIPDEEAFMDRKRCELLYTHEHSVMA